MQRTTLDVWVGLFVVGGLAALLVLALKVGNLSAFGISHSYTVYADFGNIGGLKVRAPVKSAGVVVGRVSDIEFDNKTYEARVSLNLDARYHFPVDSSADILTSGLLGEQYVGLEPGASNRVLAAGSTIRLTQSAVILENLIGQFLFNKAQGSSGASGAAGQ
ncbi:MAG: outer membrane lipid asymmetry maintenance protein MlaD [Betaproteobacteria bacterium]|nr:outer membrane lipid asymmetry maintenance protein MlaD [Betaproteobacteria bacterium]